MICESRYVMGSVSSVIKCPKCGCDAHEEYWYGTGEYSRFCDGCNWSEFHMLDYNSEYNLFSNNMPVDRNVFDITLPELSDVDFYNNNALKIMKVDNSQPVETIFGMMSSSNDPFVDMFGRRNERIDIYGAVACLLEPLENYIRCAIEIEPAIEKYANAYIRYLPDVLYSSAVRFVNPDCINKYENKRERLEQFVYETYIVETQIFDRYKHNDIDALFEKHKEPIGLTFRDTRDDWRLFDCSGPEEYLAQKFIDISDIVASYRRDKGYITFAYWYMNDYYRSVCTYGDVASYDYDFVEKLNTAANNIDYAAGRYNIYNSDSISLYSSGMGGDVVRKNRSIVVYIRTGGVNKEQVISDMKKYMLDNNRKYYNLIVDEISSDDIMSSAFKSLLRMINGKSMFRIIVPDKSQFSSNIFNLLDYLCYLNNIDLFVVDDPDRARVKDDDLNCDNVDNIFLGVFGPK